MTDYETHARSLHIPLNPFVDGDYRESHIARPIPRINPATGAPSGETAACGADDVDAAVVAARRAFQSGTWSRRAPAERKQILLKVVEQLRAHSLELAVMESLDTGKPIQDCLSIDIPDTLACLQWHAEAVDKLYGHVSPLSESALSFFIREPLGVVSCVLPWNFPLMMLAWKIGPALAGGNSVIVKPAEQTSATALRVAEIASHAGLPRGVLNVLPGEGEIAGAAIGLHPDIDAVSFTGSTEIGRRFLEYSARSNLKRVVLECGGKNPAVVLEDAEDLESVARHVIFSAFWNAGQNCTANSRLIVHRKHKAELLDLIVERARSLRQGAPLDSETTVGPLISAEHRQKVVNLIQSGLDEGANRILGGEGGVSSGYYVAPTIFDEVRPSMRIAREEIFGPVLGVIEVGSDEEAIAVANDTAYGLQASVFTASARRAYRVARAIRAGTISLNCYSEGDLTTPFGGYKLSGFGGRDKSLLAHDQYTEVKTIWSDLGAA